MTCPCCKVNEATETVSSAFGPSTGTLCSACKSIGVEPYEGVVWAVANLWGSYESLSDTQRWIIYSILQFTGKTKDQFLEDVANAKE